MSTRFVLLKGMLMFAMLLACAFTSSGQTEMDTFWEGVQKMHIKKADSAVALTYDKLRGLKPADHENISLAHYWIGTCFLKKSLDSALVHAELSLSNAQLAGDAVLLAKSRSLHGSIQNRNSEFDKAIVHFREGLQALKPQKDTLDKHYVNTYEMLLRGMSTSYNYKNLDAESMEYGLKALRYAQRHKLDHPELAGLVAISSLYYKMGQLDEAIHYSKEALAKSLEQDNRVGAAKCYTNLAIFLSGQGKYEEAEDYQLKGLAINIDMKNFDSQANNYLSLGMIKFETGRVEAALGHFLEAERIVKEMKFDLHIYDVLVNLSMAYNRQGRYKEGLAKAEELIQVATEKGRPDKQVRGYRMKYDALYGLGNYKEAVEWLEKSVVLSDSIKATENAASLQNLLVKYETEKKEEELRRITTETELKDLLIQKRNIQLMAGGVGVLTLMVLAFLMFRSYRIKNEFELLDLKQRFYRAQINPHFLFNAISSVQGFFYDRTDPNKAAGYLSRLSKLMRQILENTFDNEVTLAEEVTLMENYLEIQKVRLSDRFDYEVRVDEELGDILIPSMITQPFLENSVEHGFKELTDRKGHIVISAAETNGMVQIRIEDNGTGMADNQTKSDHRSRAMDITRERLRLLEKTKGKKARFEVVDNKANGGQGVTVLIDLPA